MTVEPPPPCLATTLSWGGSCSGPVPEVSANATGTTTSTTASTGSANYSCPPLGGSVVIASSSCTAPPPPPPPPPPPTTTATTPTTTDTDDAGDTGTTTADDAGDTGTTTTTSSTTTTCDATCVFDLCGGNAECMLAYNTSGGAPVTTTTATPGVLKRLRLPRPAIWHDYDCRWRTEWLQKTAPAVPVARLVRLAVPAALLALAAAPTSIRPGSPWWSKLPK